MHKLLILVFSAAIMTGGTLYSCQGAKDHPGWGTVALYLTDDMSLFSQVTATVTKVELMHTGSETSCDLLLDPVTINLANLGNLMQFVDATECVAGSYNRFRLEFGKSVELMSGTTGTISTCSFTSFMDDAQVSGLNILSCDPASNICALDVNGAVNVLAGPDNKVALDFDLKNFKVMDLGMPNCSVTIKVSPLTPNQMRHHGSEAVTGLVFGLDREAMTFHLSRKDRIFRVLYSGITNSNQPGLNTLLQRAEDDGLRTVVTTSNIDLENSRINAETISVKIEGIASALANGTFTMHYTSDGAGSMTIDAGNAVISGNLANGSWVQVKLIGHDPAGNNFIAGKIEVPGMGMITED